jgi:thiamine-phosphate pyrophosphorylase
MAFRIPRLYAIIDRSTTAGLSPHALAQALLSAGVRLIQYRDKKGTSLEIFEASRAIAERVRAANGIFLVNDRADIARAVEAHGVHLGQDDLPAELARHVLAPHQIIGVSTHNPHQVEVANRSTADYVAFGPVFSTQSKERADPVVGLAGLRAARRLTSKPLVAIGGITLENASSVIEAGADSVAVIQNLISAGEVGARAGEFLHVLGGT